MEKFSLIVLFCIFGAVLVKSDLNKAELMKEFLDLSEECMKESGATKADIEELMKKLPASSKEAKCMRACLMKKYKVMTKDGKLDKAMALEHGKLLSDGDSEKMKKAAEIVEACAGLAAPDDPCEATAVYGKCFLAEARKRGLDKIEI